MLSLIHTQLYGLGNPDEVQAPVDFQAAVLSKIDNLFVRFDQLEAQRKREANTRMLMFAIGAAGALLAAIRLGIITFPMVREYRTTRRTRRIPQTEPALG